MTASIADVVPDASIALRAFVDEGEEAVAWFHRIERGEVRAEWPELALLELANGLRTFVRAGYTDRARATSILDRALRWPIRSVRLADLVTAALAVALDRSLTPYDACYVVLAEMRRATLLTADRKLAAATPNAVLLA